MVVIPQHTKKRMSFSFRIQEAEALRAALETVLPVLASPQEADLVRRLVWKTTRRLAREQEWVAAGGKVSHAG